jgi:4-hydroxy-2-oxoheptanedioate aldolase
MTYDATSPDRPEGRPDTGLDGRRRLRDRERLLCLRVTAAPSADLVSVLASTAADAVYLDLEHAPVGDAAAYDFVAHAAALGMPTLVRVPRVGDGSAAKLLDGGAAGVIVPHVEDAAAAMRVVHECHFPPLGGRSVGGPVPATGFRRLPMAEAVAELTARTFVAVMVESQKAVANAGEIAAVEGVDMLLVGSADLSSDLGVPGEYQHPSMLAAYDEVARACGTEVRFGVAGGASREVVDHTAALGASFFTIGRDLDLMRDGIDARVAALR